jgi:hypothetical protein
MSTEEVMPVSLADLKAKQAAVLAAAKAASPFADAKGSDPLYTADVAPGAREVVAVALDGGQGTIGELEHVLNRAIDAMVKADKAVDVGWLDRKILRAVGLSGRNDGVLDTQELNKAKTGDKRIDGVQAQLLRFSGVQDIAIARDSDFVGKLNFRGADSFDENVASIALDVRANGTAKAVVSTGGMIGGPRTLEGRVKDGVATFSGGNGYGESIELKVSLGSRKVASLSVREIDDEMTYHFNLSAD